MFKQFFAVFCLKSKEYAAGMQQAVGSLPDRRLMAGGPPGAGAGGAGGGGGIQQIFERNQEVPGDLKHAWVCIDVRLNFISTFSYFRCFMLFSYVHVMSWSLASDVLLLAKLHQTRYKKSDVKLKSSLLKGIP